MKFSRRNKFLLLCLLILLNVVIRVPSAPHLTGDDSFVIHAMANSISEFGFAKWWLHPLSIFGLYPYSYASALSFFISGLVQCIGMDQVEHLIWIYCIFIAIFSVFAAYILAGEIIDDDLFKFFVALGFSLVPAILAYTSWSTHARGFFIVFLVLFIYLLLKCHNSILRYSPLVILLTLLLFSTHHYAYFVLPIFVSYLIVLIYFKLHERIKFIKISKKMSPFVPISGFILMYSIPFFTRHFIEYSRYIDFLSYIRYTGFFIIPAVGGLTYLIFKYDKKPKEWFLLLTVILFTVFICNDKYMKFIIPIFAILLAGIGLKNAFEVSHEKKKKYAAVVVVILLLLSVSFSGFYQHWRTNVSGIYRQSWYMTEATYTGALWIKDDIGIDKNLVYNDRLAARRMCAISEAPTFLWDADVCLLAYGFANKSDIQISIQSPLTEEFYNDAPIINLKPTIRWYGSSGLMEGNIDTQLAKDTINRFNLSYMVADKRFGRTAFLGSIEWTKNNLYDNGRIEVWSLE